MKTESSGTKNKSREKKNSRPNVFSIRRILIPIDFSIHSKNALRYAVPFAKQFDAELILMYVVEPAIYPADLSFGQVGIPGLEPELRERGKKELERLIESEIAGEVPARAIICTGKPFLEIIETANQEKVDLIIIATHGHTGVEHIFFGSTAEKVVRKAQCPALVVRPTNEDFKS